MKKDQYGLINVDYEDIFNILYSGKIKNISKILTNKEVHEEFEKSKKLNFESFEEFSLYIKPNISVKEFDLQNQINWQMPEEYKKLNIQKWLIDQSRSNQELERINQEIILYEKYKMIDVLRFLKYLVDTLRKHNIVWGVGRGSSVSSYCLYLIGIHKINSLKYSLDIRDFLK